MPCMIETGQRERERERERQRQRQRQRKRETFILAINSIPLLGKQVGKAQTSKFHVSEYDTD